MHQSVLTARTIASVLDKEFAIVESSISTLRTSPNLSKNDLEAFHDQAGRVVRETGVINIVFANADGKQFVNTLRPFGEPLPQQNRKLPLRAVNETGKPMISDLFIGQVSNSMVVAIGIPVYSKDNVVNTLAAGISTERFNKLLSQQNLPADWIASILDKSGTIVARTHETRLLVGKKSNLMSRVSKFKENAFESYTADGTAVLAVSSEAPISEWRVVIEIPSKTLSSDLNLRLLALILVTLALLSLSLFIAWMIGGRIARSVRSLAAPALALGAGKPVEFQSFNLRETDEVGMALARASEMLLEAQYKANHDVLTGLANRALLKEVLDQRLPLSERNSTCLSVLYVDLDGFKKINDEHGHSTGDKLLQAVAHRFTCEIRKSDFIARLGGDEFAIVLYDTPVTEAEHVAGLLIASLSAPYQIGNLTVQISASIGIAGFPDSGLTSKALLHRADNAMYVAKAAGKGRVMVVKD